MVLPRGNDPRSTGYQPVALPLSYGREMVRLERVERSASAVSEQRSAAELKTRGAPESWCSMTDSNRRMSVCKTDALAAWRMERKKWCRRQATSLHLIGFKPIASADWATAAWCMWKDSNLHCAEFETAASAVGLHMRIGIANWCAG